MTNSTNRPSIIQSLKSLLTDNKSTKQTILKNFFWLMTSEGFSKAAIFLITIIIARYLGASDYGKFSFAFVYVSFFGILADFGLSTVNLRELAIYKKNISSYFFNLNLIKIALSLLALLLLYSSVVIFINDFQKRQMVFILGLWIVAQSYNQFLQSFFRALEKMEYEAIGSILYSFCLVSGIIFLATKKVEVTYLVLAYLISSIISAVIIFLLLYKKYLLRIIRKVNIKLIKKSLQDAFPLALSSFLVMVYFRIDILMLSYYKGSEEVGIYNAAYNLAFSLSFITSMLTIAVFPSLSRSYLSKRKSMVAKYKKFLLALLGTGFITSLLFFLFSKNFILTVFGPDFVKSTEVFKIITWAQIFAYGSGAPMSFLTIMNKQVFYTYSAFLGAVINIVLNLILIPRYSYFGTGISTLITEILVFFFLIIFTNIQVNKLKLNVES